MKGFWIIAPCSVHVLISVHARAPSAPFPCGWRTRRASDLCRNWQLTKILKIKSWGFYFLTTAFSVMQISFPVWRRLLFFSSSSTELMRMEWNVCTVKCVSGAAAEETWFMAFGGWKMPDWDDTDPLEPPGYHYHEKPIQHLSISNTHDNRVKVIQFRRNHMFIFHIYIISLKHHQQSFPEQDI